MKDLTIIEVLANTNTISNLNLPDYKLDLYLIYKGTDTLGYVMFYENRVLFAGNDYKPAPSNNIDSLEAAIDLLSFLTIQLGDTDDEYFKDYTPQQIVFIDSFECEQLKGLVSDFDYSNDEEPEYQQRAIEYFQKSFQIL